MKIEVKRNSDEIAAYAADMLEVFLQQKPQAVLGLATGSTPLPFYRELSARYRAGKMDFSEVITFNLDEYVGLGTDDIQSFYYYMEQNLFNHINIRKENIHLFNGKNEDIKKECEDYEKQIKEIGGIDWQLLGIGSNAHIGFNEPDENFSSHVREVFLTEETIKVNARFFQDISLVPRSAITMGIGNVLEAKKIILIAEGREKAQAVREMVNGKINPYVPASALQMHKDVTIILDTEAASQLA